MTHLYDLLTPSTNASAVISYVLTRMFFEELQPTPVLLRLDTLQVAYTQMRVANTLVTRA